MSQLGENNFTDFTRYHHNTRKKLITKKDLFKSIRKLADTPESAYNYLHSMKEYAPVYASLLSPYDEWWSSQNDDYMPARHELIGLNLFNIKQPFTILMVAFFKFSTVEFIKLVRYLFVLSIRYNVICRFSPNEQERMYNQIAIKIFEDEYTRAGHIKNGEEYRSLYPGDDIFKSVFEFYKMPSRRSAKKIRFLLSEIENHLGHQSDFTKSTLEHVAPYNPEQSWCSYFGEGIYDISDRLGNMVLLEKDELKRADFDTKKTVYAQSDFNLAKKVSEYPCWNLESVNNYQRWLSEQAAEIWRID